MRLPQTAAVCLFVLSSIAADCNGDDSSNQKLQAMQQRARDVTVELVDPTIDSPQAVLVPQALIRYSDQPRRITDASFWCWEIAGKPIAFQKIEYYDREDEDYRWFYCFASASTELIRADWKVGQQWTANRPGIDLRVLEDEPLPPEMETRINFQLKRIARRFSVRLEDLIANTGEQLRLLPKPIHRYGDPKSDAMGAVFGFASNGTNPDALLLVEFSREESGNEWKYGWVQMTTGQLSARLDNQIVWTAPYRTPNARQPAIFDTWLFFYESAAGR